MDLDLPLVLGSLLIGFVVGLTGMGGGALMTPMLVLFFNVPPLTAVSSDLVAAAVMKPVGSAVHIRSGTVNWGVVKWLMIGSVPSAFAGVLILRAFGDAEQVQEVVKASLGIALLVAAAGIVTKAYLTMKQRVRAPETHDPDAQHAFALRPLATLVIGVLGGIIVGMTSVGSGSLIIIALMAVYPLMSPRSLVGTDLVQAVPLVASAALGHLLFGDFQLDLTVSLLVGCLPGVYVGAKLSTRAPGGVIRWALALVLLASALKLLGVETTTTGVTLVAVLVMTPFVWALLVRRAASRAALEAAAVDDAARVEDVSAKQAVRP